MQLSEVVSPNIVHGLSKVRCVGGLFGNIPYYCVSGVVWRGTGLEEEETFGV